MSEILSRLELRNFRNHKALSLTLNGGLVRVLGANGSGKSNLIEAISFLSLGRSFRKAKLLDICHLGETGFEVYAIWHDDRLKLRFNGGEKSLSFNKENHASFAPLLGSFPSVLILPQDLELISGAPEDRRHFLNSLLAQINPLYARALTQYAKAMAQRNCLLKLSAKDQLFPWEKQMAEAAQIITKERERFVLELLAPWEREMELLCGEKETLGLLLKSSSKTDDFLALWKEDQLLDLQAGITRHGPHRDDLEILFRERPAAIFASEGQKRMVVIALKIAAASLMEKRQSRAPLLLLDDALIHLDEARYERLIYRASLFPQAIVTEPRLQSASLDSPLGQSLALLQ